VLPAREQVKTARRKGRDAVNQFRARLAKPADIDVLVHLRHMMFEELGHPTVEQHRSGDESFRKWAVKMMRKKLLRCCLVVAENGEVAGGGSIWLREVQPIPGRKGGRVPYLLSMYTEPKFRHKGVATMVVNHQMEWARNHGYAEMSLHASRMGRALYRRLGWERTWEMEVDLKKPKPRAKRARR
jgi:GNAT superfamily N-acetyltransferase